MIKTETLLKFMASEPKRLKAPQGALRLTQGTSRYLVSPQGTFCHLKAPWISRYLQFQGTFEVPVADPGTFRYLKVPSIWRYLEIQGPFHEKHLFSRHLDKGTLEPRCLEVP